MIEIFEDKQFSIDSKDNKNKYKKVFNDNSNWSTYVGILIKNENEEIINSAIIIHEGFSIINKGSWTLQDENIFIIVGKFLICLKYPSLDYNWKIECDPSSCFKLFKLKESIIVHGEQVITSCSFNGKKNWEFYGKDIFVNVIDLESMKIENDKIYLIDFENNKYCLNLDGKII